MKTRPLPLDDPRRIAAEVTAWCEKTTDTPREGALRLQACTAVLAARASLAGDARLTRFWARRSEAFGRYVDRLDGGRR